MESLVVCTPNVSSMCLVGIWVLVPSVSALESVMKLKLFLLCHSLNAEKFEFYYTFQGTEFGNGIFISLQFSAPENPSVHHVRVHEMVGIRDIC